MKPLTIPELRKIWCVEGTTQSRKNMEQTKALHEALLAKKKPFLNPNSFGGYYVTIEDINKLFLGEVKA